MIEQPTTTVSSAKPGTGRATANEAGPVDLFAVLLAGLAPMPVPAAATGAGTAASVLPQATSRLSEASVEPLLEGTPLPLASTLMAELAHVGPDTAETGEASFEPVLERPRLEKSGREGLTLSPGPRSALAALAPVAPATTLPQPPVPPQAVLKDDSLAAEPLALTTAPERSLVRAGLADPAMEPPPGSMTVTLPTARPKPADSSGAEPATAAIDAGLEETANARLTEPEAPLAAAEARKPPVSGRIGPPTTEPALDALSMADPPEGPQNPNDGTRPPAADPSLRTPASGPVADAALAISARVLPQAVPLAQLPLEVVRAARDGAERLEVRLHPEELGSVEVTVEIGRDQRAQVVIAAERPETLELLQREVRTIERALLAQGLQLTGGGIEMGLRQQQHDHQGGSHGTAYGGRDPAGDAVESEAPARRHQPLDRLFDIHA